MVENDMTTCRPLEANGPQISGGSDSFDSHPKAADPR